MNFNKSFIYSLIFISTFATNLFPEDPYEDISENSFEEESNISETKPNANIDPTAKLFKAIADNSFEDARKAILKGADVAAINPATGKTVLYETIQNYYKYAKQPFGLNVAGASISGLSSLVGTGEIVGGIVAAISTSRDTTNSPEDKKMGYVISGGIIVTGLITAAASLLGTIKFAKSSQYIRANVRKALSILSFVYRTMRKKNIKLDRESAELIKKLIPQLDKAIS